MSRAAQVAVFGVGHADRGDDAIGLQVAARIEEMRLPGIAFPVAASPLELADAWAGYHTVVVVDATRTGSPAGSVSTHRIADGPLPTSARVLNTHDLGLADAIELARALGQLPPALFVVGVEVSDTTVGTGLSPAVQDAMAAAVDAVAGLVSQGADAGGQ